METNLQVFTNEQFGDVRIRVDANNDIEINLEDAARGLGFVQVHKERVTTSGYNYAAVRWDRIRGYLDSFGYTGEVSKDAYIPEHIFYLLAMKANNEAAEKFQDWIAREVIPSIRKRGAYMTPATIEKVFNDPDFIIRLAQELKKERAEKAALQLENTALAQQVEGLKPKASYCEWVISASGTVTTTQIAKDYGMSAKTLNKLLHKLGVQFNFGGTWYPNQKYAEKGWAVSKTVAFTRKDGTPDTRVYTVWTQKGRLGVYELLKHNGYLPIIERQIVDASEDDVEETLWF